MPYQEPEQLVNKALSAGANVLVTVTTAVIRLAAANHNRQQIFIHNESLTRTIYMARTSAVTGATGIPIPPGATYIDTVWRGDIFAIMATATAIARIMEDIT